MAPKLTTFKKRKLYPLAWYDHLGYSYSPLQLRREEYAPVNLVPLRTKNDALLAMVCVGAFEAGELEEGNRGNGGWIGMNSKTSCTLLPRGEATGDPAEENNPVMEYLIISLEKGYRNFVEWVAEDHHHVWDTEDHTLAPEWAAVLDATEAYLHSQNAEALAPYSDYLTAPEPDELGTPTETPGAGGGGGSRVGTALGQAAAALQASFLGAALPTSPGGGRGAGSSGDGAPLPKVPRASPPRPGGALHTAQGLAGPTPAGNRREAPVPRAPTGRGSTSELPVVQDSDEEDGLEAAVKAAALAGRPIDPMVMNLLVLKTLQEIQRTSSSKGTDPLGASLGAAGDISKHFKPAQNVVHAAALREWVKQNPKAGYLKLEERLKAAVDTEELDRRSTLRYIKKHSLVGHNEWAGRVLSMLATIHGALVEDDLESARFLTLGSILAVDNYLVESSWDTGYRILSIDQPPWASWDGQAIKRMQAKLVHSPLMPEEWWSVFNQEARDQEAAVKRRTTSKGAGKSSKEDAQGGGGH